MMLSKRDWQGYGGTGLESDESGGGGTRRVPAKNARPTSCPVAESIAYAVTGCTVPRKMSTKSRAKRHGSCGALAQAPIVVGVTLGLGAVSSVSPWSSRKAASLKTPVLLGSARESLPVSM